MAVVEREEHRLAFLAPALHSMRVRHLERLPLGTPYVQVVRRVGEIMQHPALAAGADWWWTRRGAGQAGAPHFARSRSETSTSIPNPATMIVETAFSMGLTPLRASA